MWRVRNKNDTEQVGYSNWEIVPALPACLQQGYDLVPFIDHLNEPSALKSDVSLSVSITSYTVSIKTVLFEIEYLIARHYKIETADDVLLVRAYALISNEKWGNELHDTVSGLSHSSNMRMLGRFYRSYIEFSAHPPSFASATNLKTKITEILCRREVNLVSVLQVILCNMIITFNLFFFIAYKIMQ